MRGCPDNAAVEDSQAARQLTPSLPMPRFFPACSELHATSPAELSRAMPAASSAPLSSHSTPPASSSLPRPVLPRFSTTRELSPLVTSMRSVTASFPRPAMRPFLASRRAFRSLCDVGSAANKKPNLAQQRTAPRVTGAAFPVRRRLVRAGRCRPSAASFFARPSQLPRHAPLSLSLGSLGDIARLTELQ